MGTVIPQTKVEIIDRDGVLYNRVAQLFPLRGMGRGEGETGRPGDTEMAKWVNSSPTPLIPAESQEIADEEPPWCGCGLRGRRE